MHEFLIDVTVSVQADNYTDAWEKVNKLMEKLPPQNEIKIEEISPPERND